MGSHLTNGERALHLIVEKDNNWMTPEKCKQKCDQKGFAFAGVDGGFSNFCETKVRAFH